MLVDYCNAFEPSGTAPDRHCLILFEIMIILLIFRLIVKRHVSLGWSLRLEVLRLWQRLLNVILLVMRFEIFWIVVLHLIVILPWKSIQVAIKLELLIMVLVGGLEDAFHSGSRTVMFAYFTLYVPHVHSSHTHFWCSTAGSALILVGSRSGEVLNLTCGGLSSGLGITAV